MIYYTIQSAKLEEWLASTTIAEALKPMNERNFVDLDPIFNVNLDEDYDFRASGITRYVFNILTVFSHLLVILCLFMLFIFTVAFANFYTHFYKTELRTNCISYFKQINLSLCRGQKLITAQKFCALPG